MTYKGALNELEVIMRAKDIPFYYQPTIKEIIHVFKHDVFPNEVIDKIVADIKEERKGYPPSADEYKTVTRVLNIIDRYIKENT